MGLVRLMRFRCIVPARRGILGSAFTLARIGAPERIGGAGVWRRFWSLVWLVNGFLGLWCMWRVRHPFTLFCAYYGSTYAAMSFVYCIPYASKYISVSEQFLRRGGIVVGAVAPHAASCLVPFFYCFFLYGVLRVFFMSIVSFFVVYNSYIVCDFLKGFLSACCWRWLVHATAPSSTLIYYCGSTANNQ